uniref:LEM domain-containing protein n=1 Tax=Hucho hucho TaxID=62062 RepID=A0A4W5LRR7_9TELE
MSPGTLPVLREEEEDVGQEEVEGEPGGETQTVSDHISVETCDDEEQTQHSDEEEMVSGEEDTQPIDEEEAEMMDSGEEEDTGIKNLGSPGGWSVVVHYDEESWDGALQDIEKIVTTGQPFAEQESENREVKNVEQGAYENSDVRCFVGVTEDVTMEITADICEEEERPDSDLEVLNSSITKKRRKEGNKVASLFSQQTFPLENEEEEEQDEDGAPEVVYDCPDPVAMVNALVEHPLQKKITEFLWDDNQEADERFAVYPSVFSPCKYKKDGGKLSSPLQGIWNTEENVDVKEEVTAAISPRVEGEQDLADCAMFNANIDTSMRKSTGYHLESQSDSNSSSEDEEEQHKYNEEHPALPRYQGLPRRDLESEDSPLQVQWGGGEEDGSKQSVADLRLSETISDVPTFTLHSEARRGRAAITISRGTGNMSSSDSEESLPGVLWTSEAEQREDKRETWLWGGGGAGPGALEAETLCEVQLELAGRLKSHIHTYISWDTRGNNVDSGGLIQDDPYEASGITESRELADEEDDEEDNRSWEQEKERIKAFYKFYNDDEEERENATGTECDFSGRKPIVQFCMDPLPQVIEYTDSSDVDLVDNLSDGDEDLDYTERLEEQSEPKRQRMSLPKTQEPQGELQDLNKMPQTHTKRDRSNYKYIAESMAALRNKSDQEIKDLLDEYGVKHGPVVDTTRPLYEKKLKEAMAKAKVTMTKPSPDRTFYREDQEEVSYVTYQTPVRSEGPSGDGKPYMRSRPEYSERDRVDDKPYSRSRPEYSERDRVDEKLYSRSRPEYSSGRQYIDESHVYNTPLSSSYSKPKPVAKSGGGVVKEEKTASSGRLIPLWIQFLVFLILAGFLYFIFTNMESAESSPFNRIQ